MKNLHDLLTKNLSTEFAVFAKKIPQRKNFKLVKISPQKTLSVSLTGDLCEQNCAHCNTHYLKGMLPLDQLISRNLENYDSVLISGGSNKNGAVNILKHKDSILALPDHLMLNIHPGFQPAKNLEFLKKRNTMISFDLPANNQVIKDIFKLDYQTDDYHKLYSEMAADFRTVPHLTLGLGEDFAKEHQQNIEFLAKIKPEQVVILVFRPTPDTELANKEPPDIINCLNFINKLRTAVKSKILIGCMRPSGLYRRNFDILAWLNNINDFVHPDHQLCKILATAKAKIIKKTQCCAI